METSQLVTHVNELEKLLKERNPSLPSTPKNYDSLEETMMGLNATPTREDWNIKTIAGGLSPKHKLILFSKTKTLETSLVSAKNDFPFRDKRPQLSKHLCILVP